MKILSIKNVKFYCIFQLTLVGIFSRSVAAKYLAEDVVSRFCFFRFHTSSTDRVPSYSGHISSKDF